MHLQNGPLRFIRSIDLLLAQNLGLIDILKPLNEVTRHIFSHVLNSIHSQFLGLSEVLQLMRYKAIFVRKLVVESALVGDSFVLV